MRRSYLDIVDESLKVCGLLCNFFDEFEDDLVFEVDLPKRFGVVGFRIEFGEGEILGCDWSTFVGFEICFSSTSPWLLHSEANYLARSSWVRNYFSISVISLSIWAIFPSIIGSCISSGNRVEF